MVQIKKKVTLKAKTEQEPVVEQVLQTSVQPTLRKKGPVKEPEPTLIPVGSGNGGNGKSKLLGGIAAAVACLLGYWEYSFLAPSEKQNEGTTTEQVKGAACTTAEGDTRDVNKDESTATPEAESVDGEGTISPATEDASSEASAPQTEPKQDAPAKTTESSKVTSQSAKTVQQTTPTAQPTSISGTLEEKAKEVIRGNYGNGEVRKQKLGDQYTEIQGKVNEMYRNGLVK